MSALEFVKSRLEKDYGGQAADIETRLDSRLAEMLAAESVSDERLTAGFQKLLNEMVYPFIACMRAMQDAGLTEEEADAYCRTIWNDMPEDLRNEIISKKK